MRSILFRNSRPAGEVRALPLIILAVVAVALGVLLVQRKTNSTASKTTSPLLVYCAAGIKRPVEAAAREYEKAYGVPVQLQYGGSGTLLSGIRVAKTGDLFVAADDSYIELGRKYDLLAEDLPLAQQRPVIAVAKGNPKNIHVLEDLWRDDVSVSLANPEAASVGRTLRALLQKDGLWTNLEKHTKVFKPTVNDVANDVKLGAVDAGVVWDATASQYPELDMVDVPAFHPAAETISIAVLKCSTQAPAALRFARYLAAKDKGLAQFAQLHYVPVDGDQWAENAEIVLHAGAMLRPGVEQTLKEFEAREGCRITTVYNGCGILCAQMRAGERPDAYFSCDDSFMHSVADLYLPATDIVDNNLMIIVQKGNPLGIHTLADLGKPGVRLGLPHPEKSAMGFIFHKLLVRLNLVEALQPNVKVESPTGDFLVNQLRTGSLDAIAACRTNYSPVSEYVDKIDIDDAGAKMTEPYAVGRGSRYKFMMTRLFERLIGDESRKRFESAGFGWHYNKPAAQEHPDDAKR